MPVITVVGPSHAGKSTLVNRVTSEPTRFGVLTPIKSVNLDEELGSHHRSDGAKAIEIINEYARRPEIAIVDCGVGQIAFSSDFREYIVRNSRALVVIWCNEVTFRSRHAVGRAEAEASTNYRPDLVAIWNLARELGRLVDTSAGIAEEQSANRLGVAISEIVQRETWILA